MLEAFAKVDIDADVMGRSSGATSGTREDPDSDEGSKSRIEGFTARIICERLRAASPGFPAADGAGYPSKVQADHRWK
jgi:hypothetical protein